MIRAVSVVVAVLILLTVGWFFGHRPVGELRSRLEVQEAEFQAELTRLQSQASLAEARGFLWAAHAELLLAAQDVAQKNFGTASDRAARARDLITRAQSTPGLTMDLGEVRELTDAALTQIGALDPAAPEVLRRAAQELNRLLDRVEQA